MSSEDATVAGFVRDLSRRVRFAVSVGLVSALIGPTSAPAQAPRPSPPPVPSPGVLAGPDRPGWAIDPRAGCWVWSPTLGSGETVAWNGRCDGQGRADGAGTVVWRSGGAIVQRLDGTLRAGKPNGRGVFVARDGWRYEGDFQDGKAEGRGVETFTNGDRYEGEYRDDRRHGRGVITFADGRRYEGEFVGGRPNGRGVLVLANGRRYEAEFRDGKANGRGVLVAADGSRYEGEFRDGKQEGRGVETLGNGDRYEGDFENDRRQGRGVYTFADGRRYDGEFRDGQPNGRGVLTFAGGRYEGEFRDGARQGRGIETLTSGERYDGGFRDNRRHGRGVLTTAGGARYEADFQDGKVGGRVVETLANGDRYEGDYRDNRRQGQGTLTFAAGGRYEGAFRDGQPDGRGVFTFPGGRRYEGEFRNGRPDGQGVITFPDGGRYDGAIRDGQPNGHGVLTLTDRARYDGNLEDGQPDGHGVFTYANGERYEGEFRRGRFQGHGVFTTATGIRYEGSFRDGRTGFWLDIDLTSIVGDLKWAPEIAGWNVAFLLLSLILTVVILGAAFLIVRWLLFLPGDHGGFGARDRRNIAVSGALGSAFASMLLAAALEMYSHGRVKALTEVFAILVVALALRWFLEPVFEGLAGAIGLPERHAENAVVRSSRRLAHISFVLFLLNGVLHTMLHEFTKEHPGLSTVLIVGWGPIATFVMTYGWTLGWDPDRGRSRAALRGAVTGALLGLAVAWSWTPYLTGRGKFVVPCLGVLVMTVVPLAGGLAVDRRWPWGRRWRPSLAMMCSMLAAWMVVGGPYWVWVSGVEGNLWKAFGALDLPIPAPTLLALNLPHVEIDKRIFLVLSAPAGIVGWGLGLWASGRFDPVITAGEVEAPYRIEYTEA